MLNQKVIDVLSELNFSDIKIKEFTRKIAIMFDHNSYKFKCQKQLMFFQKNLAL